jgi:hypothetical protein
MPPFEDICIRSPDPEGPILCALINGELGWLMYLREEGDSGFSSRNPNYDGPADAINRSLIQATYFLCWAA